MIKTYVQTLNSTLHALMEEDSRVFVIGACCVSSPWYVGGLLTGIKEKFPDRLIDGPISENAITGAAVGAAIAGMKPILIFPRMDFMLYALDPIVNAAAKWSYMFGGASSVPLVIWGIINRGGSQGAQHSQDLGWLFCKIPGLKIKHPRSPSQAEYNLQDAIADPNPVIFLDDRKLYELTETVWPPWINEPDVEPDCPIPCSQPLEEEYFKRLESSVR